jgi:hypothetical protein
MYLVHLSLISFAEWPNEQLQFGHHRDEPLPQSVSDAVEELFDELAVRFCTVQVVDEGVGVETDPSSCC